MLPRVRRRRLRPRVRGRVVDPGALLGAAAGDPGPRRPHREHVGHGAGAGGHVELRDHLGGELAQRAGHVVLGLAGGSGGAGYRVRVGVRGDGREVGVGVEEGGYSGRFTGRGVGFVIGGICRI
jgi:hypothetical protein